MPSISTPFGRIPIVGEPETHPDGTLMSCVPAGECTLSTPLGEFIPRHTTDDVRRSQTPIVSFHPNGGLRSLPLEEQTPVQTPAGTIPAELLTFHPGGSLHRVFPLGGKLSGYWTQEDETRLAQPLTFATPVGEITAKIICLRFTETGTLRGLTLWPGEVVPTPSPQGIIPARIGLVFTPEGLLESLEPAEPWLVETPIGHVMAYDPDAVGVSGDANSLCFTDQATIHRATTVTTSITVVRATGTINSFSPGKRESLCGNEEKEPVPMRLTFCPQGVAIRTKESEPQALIPFEGSRFITEHQLPSPLQPLRIPEHSNSCTGQGKTP